MKNHSLYAGVLATMLFASLPATVGADEKPDFEAAWAEADEARKKAASVGGEWRDTGKMLKKAKEAAAAGEHEKAMKLVNKAKKQGELGYEQAVSEKDADLPDYIK